jgi:hypothetical protein
MRYRDILNVMNYVLIQQSKTDLETEPKVLRHFTATTTEEVLERLKVRNVRFLGGGKWIIRDDEYVAEILYLLPEAETA